MTSVADDRAGEQSALKLPPELWEAYAQLAKARYEQEEERWRSAQDKAKTVFAVAAIVGSIMFARADVIEAATVRWATDWVSELCLIAGGLLLLASCIIAARVLMPKSAAALEGKCDTLSKLATRDSQDGPEYVGKAYDAVAQENTCRINQALLGIRWAMCLLIVSLVLAIARVSGITALLGTVGHGG